MTSPIYVKMYVDAVKEGLIADMGDTNWQTLCVLASFMDKDGVCYPTQSQIAKCLGITRQSANKRIKRLLNYRWKGKAVVTATKDRRTDKGVFDNTTYRIAPDSGLRIFDEKASM